MYIDENVMDEEIQNSGHHEVNYSIDDYKPETDNRIYTRSNTT